MTCIEMRTEAELLYESINSSDSPGFTAEEWANLFTIAQRRVVLRILEDGINKNAFNQLAIEKLVQKDSITNFSIDTHFKNINSTSTEAQTIDIGLDPFDPKYFWLLDEYVETGAGGTLVTNIPIKRITYDFYRINKDNPFRGANASNGYWMFQYNSTPVFITDGLASITKYCVIGVQHPDNYSIGIASPAGDCILNEGVHSLIVEEAVRLARMSIVDVQGYQIAAAEFAKQN